MVRSETVLRFDDSLAKDFEEHEDVAVRVGEGPQESNFSLGHRYADFDFWPLAGMVCSEHKQAPLGNELLLQFGGRPT
jgi:hypothetical protein